MNMAILFKDRSPKWFYTWYIMGPIGLILEFIFCTFFPFLTGYGIMGALFGFTGKWLASKKMMIKFLAFIVFWGIGAIFRLYMYNNI